MKVRRPNSTLSVDTDKSMSRGIGPVRTEFRRGLAKPKPEPAICTDPGCRLFACGTEDVPADLICRCEPADTAVLEMPRPRSSERIPAGRRVGAATGNPKPINDFSPTTRALVRERSGGRCEACGAEPAVIHHHRRPRRHDGWRPGTNEASNDLRIGLDCNERIEHQDRAGAYPLGQLLHAEQDPAVEPVLYRGRWVLLGDDGSVEPYGRWATDD